MREMPVVPAFAKQIPCRNEECRDSIQQKPYDWRPMKMIKETHDAWSFKCETCGFLNGFSKNYVGGTLGQGVRNNGTGPSTGKGPNRYRTGVNF